MYNNVYTKMFFVQNLVFLLNDILFDPFIKIMKKHNYMLFLSLSFSLDIRKTLA